MNASPSPNVRRSTATGLTGRRVGRYVVGDCLGRGGAASVYLARLVGPYDFERLAALKVIHEHLAEEEDFSRMLLDEAKLSARLSHPNIVHIYELGREGGALFLAMEYLSGQPLAEVIGALAQRGASLPPDIVAWLGLQAARALEYAHGLSDETGKPYGIIHRDVSPQNVFLTYDGQVKLIDFGIASAAGRITTTAVGKIKGTYAYMAPERALGQDVDGRSDLFSLGAVLWEAATGRRLFRGEDEVQTLANVLECVVPDPTTIAPDLPLELGDLILCALDPDPERRTESARVLREQLESCLAFAGGTDQQDRLAAMMVDLFGDRRKRQQASIEALRLLGDVEAYGTETTAVRMTATGAEASAASRRKRLLAAGALGVAMTAALIGMGSGGDEAEPNGKPPETRVVAPAPPPTVTAAPAAAPPAPTAAPTPPAASAPATAPSSTAAAASRWRRTAPARPRTAPAQTAQRPASLEDSLGKRY